MNRLAPTLLAITASLTISAAQIPVPDDAPQPLSPAESKKQFQLPAGFRIDLIASEPLIADPSGIAWDEHGRLFVTEIHGYNLEGHLDITELNRSGKLDTAIRRVRVGAEMKTEARKKQTGSLKLLRDRDGDGRMDEAITWADDIPAAYGVVPARGGVIVTAEPHILFFADRDGDDHPEVREVLFSGFGRGEMERAINNPVWGPDNWIYAGQGWGGGTITGPRLERPVEIGRSDFRFRPDGSAIEAVSGSNHTFGMSFDDSGNRWLITTSQPARYAAPLPRRYLLRNPHVPAPETTIGASGYGDCFPISQPHPWRRKRGADPRWVDFYGAGEAKPNGNFTSACGQEIYRAALFPGRFYGNHFCCDPQQNLVHRSLISREGAGLKTTRPAEHMRSEFLASRDGWFRPTNLRTGPDGALYIVDMYREIIEDYSAIPRYLQQQYGLLNGDDRGRIWRLAPQGSPPAELEMREVGRPANLHHANHWWRRTAQRLLVEGGKFHPEIGALLGDAKAPFQNRIAALYTLSGLGAVTDENLITALSASHPALRIHALRIAESRPQLLPTLLGLIGQEDDPNTLLQLALSLGESDHPDAAAALAKLAADHGDIRWMTDAVLSSIARQPGAFLEAVLENHPEVEIGLLEKAAITASALGDRGAITAVLQAGADQADRAAHLRLIELAANHQLVDPPELKTMINERLLDTAATDSDRLAALRLIGLADRATAAAALGAVLAPTRSPEFQEQAVRAALARPARPVAERLIAELPNTSPRVAASIIEALLGHPETARSLLASGKVPPSGFSDLQRHRLLQHDDRELAASAQTFFSVRPAPVQAEDAPFHQALRKDPDLRRGAKLFSTHCATCHQFAGEGKAVGPPLDPEVGRPAESLLADVLYPAAEITAGYATYLLKSRSGASAAGVLASESATSLTVVHAGGASTTWLRQDLASIERLDLSLMPTTLRETLRPAELADVIGYLRSRPAPASLLLFDDDPSFPAALGEGRGTAKLDWSDAYSGKASLTVAGFQRYSRQVPGWSFAVRESPDPGEFRYLRLAIKTGRSHGIMVELAAEQSFPPEDRAVRTYYAGKNSTGWISNQLAEQAPEDWQTFTIDLWEGNGDFTLTGIALTVMGGSASFDRLELLRRLQPDP